MMTGETVLVDGTDPVENVLVASAGYNQVPVTKAEINRPEGPVADYTLYFPIEYNEDLTGRKITVRGYECDVLGQPDHERPRQVFGTWFGNWDMVVYANRTLAPYAETIKIFCTTYTRDYLGNRTAGTPEKLYDGPAQARLEEMDEQAEKPGTISRETRFFVLPWQTSLAGKSTQSLSVEWNGGIYDVLSVENVDEKGETASIKGVRRDE